MKESLLKNLTQKHADCKNIVTNKVNKLKIKLYVKHYADCMACIATPLFTPP